MSFRPLASLAFVLAALSACSSSSDAGPSPASDSSPPNDTATSDGEGPVDTAATDTGATTDTGGDATVGDTWDSFAMGFFSRYCVECHAGGTRDYRTVTQVKRDQALIRCGVASTTQTGCGATAPKAKQFPIDDSTKTNPKPTDAERDRIVAWLAAGEP